MVPDCTAGTMATVRRLILPAAGNKLVLITAMRIAFAAVILLSSDGTDEAARHWLWSRGCYRSWPETDPPAIQNATGRTAEGVAAPVVGVISLAHRVIASGSSSGETPAAV